MGCWNGTCAVSNLHILHGEEVVVIMLVNNNEYDDLGSYCYSTSYNKLMPVIFYGEYDDYGSVENTHGIALPMIIAGLKERLFEYEIGDNKSHDIAVKKENFNEELMFDAARENRLAITRQYGIDLPTPVTVAPVMVLKSVFDNIMTEYCWDEYLLEADANGSHHHQVYVKDIIASIPDYIKAMIKHFDVSDKNKHDFWTLEYIGNNDPDVQENLWHRFIARYYRFNQTYTMSVVSMPEELLLAFRLMATLASENADQSAVVERITQLMTEAAQLQLLTEFMSDIRGTWIKPTGDGSQQQEDKPYRSILAQIVVDHLNDQRHRWDEDDG